MEADLQPSLHLEDSVDNEDAKYISGLSTKMVATIQEVKDSISQIEYIFCDQLFPMFQSKPKSLQKLYAETMKDAEDEWREKEKQSLIQIEELQFQKKKALEDKAKLTSDRKTAEDEWKWKESVLQMGMDELCDQKNKALEENQILVASLKKDKTELMHKEKLLKECEAEKKLLMDKLQGLQNNEVVADLQIQLKHKTEEVAMGKQLQEKLFQQIEKKELSVMTERKKRRDVVDTYKRLKSQYNFLCIKIGLNTENSIPCNRMEEKGILSGLPQDQENTLGPTEENPQSSGLVTSMNKHKDVSSLQEKMTDGPVSRFTENSGSLSNIRTPSTSSFRPMKSPVSVKSEPITGIKRPLPCWRETRSHQEAGGADPHDAFLDTPLENVKGKFNKLSKQEVHDIPVPPPRDIEFDSSNDETQDMNGEPSPPKQTISITKAVDKGFKFVEPVRKKADRENLKGFECKQCKKFYDAVLPENGKNGENNNCNFRCEHHDGVSRHRYKYVPPMTPEGFWNIGFESEILLNL